MNYAMLGRWAFTGAVVSGFLKSIKEAQPMGGENVVGWTLHYLTGIAFAQVFDCFRYRAPVDRNASLGSSADFWRGDSAFPWTVF